MAEATVSTVEHAKRAKRNFVLLDPETKAVIGKFVAYGFREAALKAATRGHTEIVLQNVEKKRIRVYEGAMKTLDEPKRVTRGSREVVFSRRPFVKHVKPVAQESEPEPESEESEGLEESEVN
jgi:hypothetical protein